MKFRFREWGSADWTYIDISGELEDRAASVLGSALGIYHVQFLDNGKWENL